MDNNDLALIFSHHMQGNYNGETSRKRLHEELDEKADDLSCIISFTSYSQQQQLDALNLSLCAEFGKKPNHLNLLRSHTNNENIVNFGAQFEGNARRTRVQAQEHLLAERKRRQKISKLFVSLASLLPGHNKMDKASILEGATNLIRQLGERAETTEDHTKTNKEKEDSTIVKKAQNYENQYSSIDMMMKSSSLLPQVEVKSSEEELLITILLVYPQKQQKGIIDQILSAIQRFHLTIKTSSFMPFGSTSMHITVIAQMNAEFCETTDFLAKKLRSSIIKL